jgi:hypothetical protein
MLSDVEQKQRRDALAQRLRLMVARARLAAAPHPLPDVEVRVEYMSDQDGPTLYESVLWAVDVTWDEERAGAESAAWIVYSHLLKLVEAAGMKIDEWDEMGVAAADGLLGVEGSEDVGQGGVRPG